AAGTRLAGHRELRVGREHPAQPVPYHRMVVDDEQPDGRHPAPPAEIAGAHAEIAVPAPGSDSTASVPAMRRTRSRIAVNPNPPSVVPAGTPAGSNPVPSS